MHSDFGANARTYAASRVACVLLTASGCVSARCHIRKCDGREDQPVRCPLLPKTPDSGHRKTGGRYDKHATEY